MWLGTCSLLHTCPLPFRLCMVFILACSISCRHLSCGFYSTHIPLPNIYHVLFLAMPLLLQAVSALLSCVSPYCPSSILSCRSFLSMSSSSPPQVAVSAGWLYLHQLIFMAPWGRTPVHIAPSLVHIHSSNSPSWSELWGWRVSAGSTKLSMPHCAFLASERAVGNKREGKSSQETKEVFPGEVWKEIGSQ